MKNLFFAFLGFLLGVNACFATRYVTQTYTTPNYNPNIYNTNYFDAASHNRLAEIEQSFYGRTYANQNPNARLNRLEKSVFSRTYPNMPFEQRMNNLIMNYNNNYQNNYSRISTKTSKLSNFINGLNNTFYGTPTGMTPQISPYYDYNNPNWGRQNSYYGNNGWRLHNGNIGSSTGIRIID